MTKRLFVGNLPFSIDDVALREMFSSFGDVLEANIIIDRATNRSKGFGFVEMEEAAAVEAIKSLDGKEVESRQIVVNEARPMEARDDRRSDPRGGRRETGGNRRRY